MQGPSHEAAPAQREERSAALALVPIAATLGYYTLPGWLQERTLVQFAPQIIAYLACALWVARNHGLIARFGLERPKIGRGLRWGSFIGLALGGFNSLVILQLFPHFGYDIAFLRNTPHARLPLPVMMPWFICAIALFVEFNFRGFLLGRLITLGTALIGVNHPLWVSVGAVSLGALMFAYDPFMTNTFRHLHWIALWDGFIWGLLWVRMRNLYATVAAHAVEVMVMYSAVRVALIA